MRVAPFKVVCQLVACKKNDNGQVVGEQQVAELVLYEPDFHKLRERIHTLWPDVVAQLPSE